MSLFQMAKGFVHIDSNQVVVRQNLNGEFYVEVCEWEQREHWSHQYWSEDEGQIQYLASQIRERGNINTAYWVNT